MKKDIETIIDIELLVHEFYTRVRENPLIGAIFIGAIKNEWPAHLDKLCRFWQTVLLGGQAYSGSPFKPHARMPLQKKHFDVWLGLFYQTIEENFKGEKAEEAKWRAQKMGEMFLYKIEYQRNNPHRELL